MKTTLDHLKAQLSDVDATLARINDSKKTLMNQEAKLVLQKNELLKGIAQLTIVKEEAEKP